MSAKASLFKETDIKRAVRATRNAGIDIGRIDIGKDGGISIVPREPVEKTLPKAPPAGPQPESWD